MPDPERERLAADGAALRRWGPYLSERAWGTVREDDEDLVETNRRRGRVVAFLSRHPGCTAGAGADP